MSSLYPVKVWRAQARTARCGSMQRSALPVLLSLLPLLLPAVLAQPRTTDRQQLLFRHSWKTLPVFWFSANASGAESPAEMALISKYSAAVLSWELGTQGAVEPWRHTDTKMRALAAKLSTTAPQTEVIMYMQSQLAMDWYEITRALLPPPCGTDNVRAFEDFWLLDNSTHRPAAWPSPRGSICRSLNGSDLQCVALRACVRVRVCVCC